MVKRNNRNLLPSQTNQKWSHATNTIKELKTALKDKEITSIEADVLMGHAVTSLDEQNQTSSQPIAIMSHPPIRTSDLTLQHFLTLASGGQKHELQKHIKLDIKDVDAVPSIFDILESLGAIANPNNKFIYIHKDIVAGPGKRDIQIKFDVGDFFKKCLDGIERLVEKNYQNEKRLKFAFSLAHVVDNRSPEGYTLQDMEGFLDILKQNNITSQPMGIVYTPNARLLLKNFEPVDYLLKILPRADIVVWTGHGEPPISQSKINQITQHFLSKGTLDRVGFDCQVASSYAYGFVTDTFVRLQGTVLYGSRSLKLRYSN